MSTILLSKTFVGKSTLSFGGFGELLFKVMIQPLSSPIVPRKTSVNPRIIMVVLEQEIFIQSIKTSFLQLIGTLLLLKTNSLVTSLKLNSSPTTPRLHSLVDQNQFSGPPFCRLNQSSMNTALYRSTEETLPYGQSLVLSLV